MDLFLSLIFKTALLISIFFFNSFIAQTSNAQIMQIDNSNQQRSCMSYAPVPVTVIPEFEMIQSSITFSLARLQEVARKSQNIIPTYDNVVLGLTQYQPVFEFAAPIWKQARGDGSFCARAESVSLRIGYKDINVIIADEFKPGSCAYNFIMQHEQKHVDVNRGVLIEYSALLKKKIEDYLRINGLMVMPNPSYAEKILKERVLEIIKKSQSEMDTENRRRQKLIDSPEEYAKANSACNGTIAKQVRDYINYRK